MYYLGHIFPLHPVYLIKPLRELILKRLPFLTTATYCIGIKQAHVYEKPGQQVSQQPLVLCLSSG